MNLNDIPEELLRLAEDMLDGQPEYQKTTDPETKHALIEHMVLQILIMEKARRNPPVYRWDESTFNEVAVLSERLIESFPNTRLIGIGNSPSYVIHGIDCSPNKQNLNIETGHLPFSSRYMSVVDYPEDAISYRVDLKSPDYKATYNAAVKNRNAYRRLLEELSLDPKNIVETFQKSGKKTIVIDNIQSGTSFASFIDIMYDLTEESGINKTSFSDAFGCAVFSSIYPISAIILPDKNLYVGARHFEISQFMVKVLSGLYSQETDRFIPSYAPEDWDKPPRAITGNERIVNEIKSGIMGAVQAITPLRPTNPVSLQPEVTSNNSSQTLIL
ncbi:MAG: hypothetical protein PHX43_08820 [Alphaproteobacteria bacterium]|nr:hypothetical protein [Alphaproteobacteria bacterium]